MLRWSPACCTGFVSYGRRICRSIPGNLIPAPEALALGLINKVVLKEELETEARQWAEELAQKSPLALQIAKKAFYNTEDLAYEQQFAHMNEAWTPSLASSVVHKRAKASFIPGSAGDMDDTSGGVQWGSTRSQITAGHESVRSAAQEALRLDGRF